MMGYSAGRCGSMRAVCVVAWRAGEEEAIDDFEALLEIFLLYKTGNVAEQLRRWWMSVEFGSAGARQKQIQNLCLNLEANKRHFEGAGGQGQCFLHLID